MTSKKKLKGVFYNPLLNKNKRMKKKIYFPNLSFAKKAIKLCYSAWSLTLILLLWSLQVSSQPKVIVNGTVTSSPDNLPLTGSTILEKGSSMNATTADKDGKFVLAVSGEKAVLVISFIGMKTMEVSINADRTPLNIVLQEDNYNLEAVIVTGYGTLKKEAYAGSASIIKMDKLADVPVLSIANLLQGSASGVQVTNTSGQPGGATQIRIRGVGSFNASNDPLYVIDGVPVISGNISAIGSSSGLDILSTINPSSIESISVIS